MKFATQLISIIFSCTFCFATQGKVDIATVSACELASHPERYNEKIVRLQVIEQSYYHGSFFYDVCGNRTVTIVSWLDCPDKKVCDEMMKALSHKDGGARIGIVAVGKFYYKGLSDDGFGHLSKGEYGFGISQIEKTFSVPNNAPRPGETNEDKNAGEVNVLEFDWKEAQQGISPSPAGSGRTLDNILADDYRLITPYGEVKNKEMHLAEVKDRNAANRFAWIVNDQLKTYGDVVIATGRLSVVSQDKEAVNARYTNIYSKRNGLMQLVHTQVTIIAEK